MVSLLRKCRELKKAFVVIICILLVTAMSLIGCSGTSTTPTPKVPPPTTTKETLKAPEIVMIHVDKLASSVLGLNMSIQTRVFNPNSQNINIDTLKITTKGEAGVNYAEDTVPGGPAAANTVTTFNVVTLVPFEAMNEGRLNISIDATTSGISPASPVSAATTYEMPSTSKLLITPKIALQAKTIKLYRVGAVSELETKLEGTITNLNPTKINFSMISITVKNDMNSVVATSTIEGGAVEPNANYSFTRSINLPPRIINTIVTYNVEVLGKLGRYSLPFWATASLNPKLRELISIPKISLETESKWTTTSTPTLQLSIDTLINNSNMLDMTTGDLHVKVYKPNNTLIDDETILSTAIKGIPGSSTRTLSNTFSISPSTVGFIGYDATIRADIEVGIEGVTEKIPLNVSAVHHLEPKS